MVQGCLGRARRKHLALLAVVTSGVALAGSCGGNGPVTVRSDIAVVCTESAVKPGAPIPTGTKVCNSVSTGAPALSADFSNGSSDDLVEIYPGANITDIHEAVTFENGTAVLHSSGSGQEADVLPRSWLQATAPADLVLAVDFKGLSADSTLGFSPRCSKDVCILVAVDGDGKFRFSARNGHSWTYPLTGDLNADTGYPAPRLDAAGENRLIVWLSRGKMGASLNGRLLGSLDAKPAPAMEAFLFFRSLQRKSTHVALTRIFFFAAGQ